MICCMHILLTRCIYVSQAYYNSDYFPKQHEPVVTSEQLKGCRLKLAQGPTGKLSNETNYLCVSGV